MSFILRHKTINNHVLCERKIPDTRENQGWPAAAGSRYQERLPERGAMAVMGRVWGEGPEDWSWEATCWSMGCLFWPVTRMAV